jgi:very-short-patch-repair endonuclease
MKKKKQKNIFDYIIDFILSLFENKQSQKIEEKTIPISDKILNTKKDFNNSFNLKYKKKDFLLTKKELSFYNFLVDNISDKYSVMCSVRLIDIIEPLDKKDFTARAKVIQKHIDFLVCSKWYLNPILAIELNDTSHRNSKRYERDNFLDLVFQSAWLPLLFVSTRDLGKKEYLKSLLSDFIEIK